MTDPLATLAARMVRSRTIGFVGAGASARFGLPLWNDLVNALYVTAQEYADELPEPGPSIDQRWLAEVYGSVIGKHTSLHEALNTIFAEHRRLDLRPAEERERLHDLIARLPFKHFITTNYDKYIEEACNRVFETVNGRKPVEGERCITRDGRVSAAFSDFLAAFSQDTRQSVLHLHGALEGENVTLSLAEYDDQYLQDDMLLRMFSIFATSTVVFIGSSLKDADLMELVRRSTYHTGRRQRHYAFLTLDRHNEAELLRRTYGIEPIFYSPGEDGRHEELERKLERLLELVEPLASRQRSKASGNARPVITAQDDEFEGLIELVKDEVRRVRGGAARVSGLPESGLSRVLRRIASDYREMPISYRFHHVIWISPGRIGFFPDSTRSRGVLNSVIGEVVYALGRDRVTGTADRMASIRSIRDVVRGRRWADAEPVLFVVDGLEDLLRDLPTEEREMFDELFSFLPLESVALFGRSSSEPTPPDPQSRVDPVDKRLMGDSVEKRRWTRDVTGRAICSHLDKEENPDTPILSSMVLAALCLVATPIAAEELALMLEVTLRDLDHALSHLAKAAFIERYPLGDEKQTNTIGGLSSPIARTGSIGVLNPIRREVLKEEKLRDQLISVTSALLKWAEATVEGFTNWEEDTAQLDELTKRLPNVLTVFEATCWLTALGPGSFEKGDVDRHLWLGTDLSYILYNVGRWAEAKEMLDYLRGRANGSIPDAPDLSEPNTFLREVLILQSRYREHAGASENDFNVAAKDAENAIENARIRAAKGDEEYEPGRNTYAPNRLTLARQRARAEIARGLALLRTKDDETAESILSSILRDRAFDGPRDGDKGDREARDERMNQRESLLIVADASRALADVRIAQLDKGSLDEASRREIFRELDSGREAVAGLNSRRARGHSGLKRGDILYRLDNKIAARRYYARSLIIAIEFRDRFLEAGAILGLANCDRDHRLAIRAKLIYEDLGMVKLAQQAEDSVFRLHHQTEPGTSAAYPSLISVVGLPGTGKSIVSRAVGSVLAEWGHEPVIRRDNRIEKLRLGENVDLSDGQVESIAEFENEIIEQHRNAIGLIEVPTGRLKDLFEPWMRDSRLIGRMLCIQMKASAELLHTRNAQRRSGQIPTETLQKMIEDHDGQDPASLGYTTWESAFQDSGGAMVTVDSSGSILGLERRIRDALALSYSTYVQLRRLKGSEGSTG